LGLGQIAKKALRLTIVTVIPKLVIVVGFMILVSEVCDPGIFQYVEEDVSPVFSLRKNEDVKGMWRCKAFGRFAYEATRENIVVVTAIRDFIYN
jgi:hypothetical protein